MNGHSLQDVRQRLTEAADAARRRRLLVDLTTEDNNDLVCMLCRTPRRGPLEHCMHDEKVCHACAQVGTHLPVRLMQQNTSAVAPCTPSIECYPQYAVPAAAVVSIYVPDVRTKTVGLCSGASMCLPLAVTTMHAQFCSSPPHPCRRSLDGPHVRTVQSLCRS